MDNKERLRLFLKEAEDMVLEAAEEFKNSSPRTYGSTYDKFLTFCSFRGGKGIVFNFDYLFYFKHRSGIEYIEYILKKYSGIAGDLHAVSHIITLAVSELEFIYNEILFDKLKYTWYLTDNNTRFDSSYYLKQIDILEDYRKSVIEKEMDICVMENKLGKGIDNKERVNRLFIDLAIVEREIEFLNDTLYNVFNIE